MSTLTRIDHIALLAGVALLAACGNGSIGTIRSGPPPGTLLVTEHGFNFAAKDEREVTNIARRLDRTRPEVVNLRGDVTQTGIEAIPFLIGTEIGRNFLAAPFPRVLTRGAPADSCPASALAVGAPGEARSDVAVRAFEGCFDALRAAGAPEDCGCEVIAFDGVVAVAREGMAYSTGTSARMRSPALGVDALLVAEDIGTATTLLRDLVGPVAILRHTAPREVELEFLAEPGVVFRGPAVPQGFRRGRIAEVMTLTDGAGRQVKLAVGFSALELENMAGMRASKG